MNNLEQLDENLKRILKQPVSSAPYRWDAITKRIENPVFSLRRWSYGLSTVALLILMLSGSLYWRYNVNVRKSLVNSYLNETMLVMDGNLIEFESGWYMEEENDFADEIYGVNGEEMELFSNFSV